MTHSARDNSGNYWGMVRILRQQHSGMDHADFGVFHIAAPVREAYLRFDGVAVPHRQVQEKFSWLEDGNIRDAAGRRPGHPVRLLQWHQKRSIEFEVCQHMYTTDYERSVSHLLCRTMTQGLSMSLPTYTGNSLVILPHLVLQHPTNSTACHAKQARPSCNSLSWSLFCRIPEAVLDDQEQVQGHCHLLQSRQVL